MECRHLALSGRSGIRSLGVGGNVRVGAIRGASRKPARAARVTTPAGSSAKRTR